MGSYNDEAVVLRTHRLGEADRIVTILSRRHGKLRGVAKGVRRTTSKMGARLEPFAHVDLRVTEGRALDIFSSVVSRSLFGKELMSDYSMFTAAEVMVEVADKLVGEERVPALRQFLLLVGALRALTEGTTDGLRSPTVVLDSYILRASTIAGYAPALDSCAVCGIGGEHGFFHPASGGVVCMRDRPSGAAAISQDTRTYLDALVHGRWADTRDVPRSLVMEASGLVTAFLAWHVEGRVRSLTHVDRSMSEKHAGS